MSADAMLASLRRRRASLRLDPLPVEGRLVRAIGLTLEAEGVDAVLGDRCTIEDRAGRTVAAEVVGFDRDRTILMPFDAAVGLPANAVVRACGMLPRFPAGRHLLGRVIDAGGVPLDGLGALDRGQETTLHRRSPEPLARAGIDRPLDTGLRAINGLLTFGRGQRVGLFAGSGVGKSALLGMMTRHARADVTVVALIGERGREVRDFVRDTLGDEGLARAVVVAAPADVSPLQRLQGAMFATAIAEHFRDEGLEVLLVVDSLTRFAQAQREIGLAAGEPPATRGFPPSTFALLPRLVERAGGVVGGGSITGIYTVLTEGDDHDDPVADAARAILDGHIVLSRALADAGHYPAIDINRSVSRVRDAVIDPVQQRVVREVLRLAAHYRANEDMLRVGLYSSGSDPELDRAIALWPRLERFLQQEREEGSTLEDSRAALQSLLVAAPPSAKVATANG